MLYNLATMKKILLLVFCSFAGVATLAQDIGYSQFFANRIALNPAFAIAAPGTNLYITGRNQWLKIPDHAFSFAQANVSVSTEIADRFHGGLDISSSSEGEGYLQNYHFGVIGGYFLPLQKKHIGNTNQALSLGIEASYNIQSINWDRLVFSDQIDPVLGQISNTSQAIPPITPRKSFLDMDLGVLYEQSVGKRSFYEAGLHIQHILTPETSIQNLQSKLPIHFTIHGGGSFCVNPHSFGNFLFLSPNLKADLQDVSNSRLTSFSLGTNIIYVPSTKAGRNILTDYVTVFTGFYFQNRYPIPYDGINTAAFTILAGTKIKREYWNTEIILSYDLNAGGINHSNTTGTIELSILMGTEQGLLDLFRYGLDGKNKSKNRDNKGGKTKKCPSWGKNSYART